MDYVFDFVVVGWVFVQGVGIVGVEDGGNIVFGIFFYVFCFDDVGVVQMYFFIQYQMFVLFVGFFVEVCVIDLDFGVEWYFMIVYFWFVWMVWYYYYFVFVLWIVFDNQFYWIDYCYCVWGVFVQIFMNVGFQ